MSSSLVRGEEMGNVEGSVKKGEGEQEQGEELRRKRVVGVVFHREGRSALLSAGKRPVGAVRECVVVLVNCPLDPDDPPLIALLCLHYLRNDHIWHMHCCYLYCNSLTITVNDRMIADICHLPLLLSLATLYHYHNHCC